MKKKILFLSAEDNNPLNNTAKLLYNFTLSAHSDLDCDNCNIFDFMTKNQKELTLNNLDIYNSSNTIWEYRYDRPLMKKNDNAKKLFKFFNSLYLPRLISFIKDFNPNYILCADITSMYSILSKKSLNKIKANVDMVINSFGVNKLLFNKYVRYYFCHSKAIKDRLIDFKKDGKLIFEEGIPTESKGSYDTERYLRNKRKNSNYALSVLLETEGFNDNDIKNFIKSIGDNQKNIMIEVIVNTAENKQLHKALSRLRAKKWKFMKLISEKDNKIKLMREVDVAILKPYGYLLPTALSVGVPILFLDPLPGIEEVNASYLVEKGAAVSERNIYYLCYKLFELAINKELLREMKSRAFFNSKQQSSSKIIDIMIDYKG